MAVVHVIGPISLFYGYWRTSFADFVASMLSFWITLFVSTETGIAVAVVFSLCYTMLRSTFAKVHIYSSAKRLDLPQSVSLSSGLRDEDDGVFIPPGTMVMGFEDAIFFPNANRVKNRILESVQVMYEPTAAANSSGRSENRSWSIAAKKRIEAIRRHQNIRVQEVPLAVLIWDFGRVPFVDHSGLSALRELREEVDKHVGKGVDLRFTSMSASVQKRFERAGWKLAEDGDARLRDPEADVLYPSLNAALWDRGDWYGRISSELKL